MIVETGNNPSSLPIGGSSMVGNDASGDGHLKLCKVSAVTSLDAERLKKGGGNTNMGRNRRGRIEERERASGGGEEEPMCRMHCMLRPRGYAHSMCGNSPDKSNSIADHLLSVASTGWRRRRTASAERCDWE